MFCCACTEGDGQLIEPVAVLESSAIPPAKEVETTSAADTVAILVQEPTLPESPRIPDPAAQGTTVTVMVLAAKGLRNADWAPGTGKSDAFVTVGSAGVEAFSTPVVKDSLQPVWNFEGQVTILDGAPIEFSIWDQDATGKDYLGKATLAPSDFTGTGFSGDLQIEEAGEGVQAILRVKVKLPGKDYLPGCGSTFAVTIDKGGDNDGPKLGMDLDMIDSTLLHIVGIKPGLVAAHNDLAAPELRLAPGYFITAINGVKDDAAQMVLQLQQERLLHLTVQRAEEFAVPIAKKDGTLGLDLNFTPSAMSLLVVKVPPGGAVAEWNAAHPDQEVKSNDRIISVNEKTGAAKDLFEALKESDKLRLVFSRPASDTWWGVL